MCFLNVTIQIKSHICLRGLNILIVTFLACMVKRVA